MTISMTPVNRDTRRKGQAVCQRTTPSPDTTYWEIDLGGRDGACFYSGFSGDITGIFIPTYQLKPLGHPVAVRLIIDACTSISVRGAVEWIREHNSLVPETEPGLGVRFSDCSPGALQLVEDCASSRESLFYDGASVDSTSRFFGGLARDIAAHLEQQKRPHPQSIERPGGGDTVAADQALSDLLHAAAARSLQGHRFIGGFKEEDIGFRVFVETGRPRPIGAVMPVRIDIGSGGQLVGVGEVKWIRRYNPIVSCHAAPPGIGLCLTGIHPEAWQRAFPDHTALTQPIICEEVL